MTQIIWQSLPFDQLTTQQLYQLLKLRVDVFVVEQTCPYPELDNKDHQPGVHHLLGYDGENLIACARILPAGISYQDVSIGRIATAETVRGQGLGNALVNTALIQCQSLWPNQSITIGAQEHLANFYQTLGFVQISDMYLEDDIPHIDMRIEK